MSRSIFNGAGAAASANKEYQIGTIADCVALMTNPASRWADARPLLAKLINAGLDFDSAIQAKLIAKMLVSAIEDIQTEGSSDRSDEIIQA